MARHGHYTLHSGVFLAVEGITAGRRQTLGLATGRVSRYVVRSTYIAIRTKYGCEGCVPTYVRGPYTTARLSVRHADDQIRAGTVVAYFVGWTGRLRFGCDLAWNEYPSPCPPPSGQPLSCCTRTHHPAARP